MKTNRPNGFAIILIALGVLILLGKLTPFLGSLFGLVISVVMIALGYYGIRRGNAFFGWIVLFFGVISLISKLAWLIVPVLGIGLIVYGISSLRSRRSF
ncbi:MULTISPECIES: LiaF transmembrane domain-containing protein [Paenibacillus]|uniref:LiaF transmembrane domain-containing protein n=1 Tax=Paenibacillus TaxID=44249 RepID=UPI002FE33487